MKRTLFYILIFFSFAKINAQDINTGNITNLIGIQARVIDVMPLELSFIHNNTKGISYLIRGGYGYAQINKLGDPKAIFDIPIPYSYSTIEFLPGASFAVNQTQQVLFFKPGIIISKKVSPNSFRYFSLNANFAYSFDKIVFTSSDPLYGNYLTGHKQQNFYQSVEIERAWNFKISKNIFLNSGMFLGIKLLHPLPFDKEIIGLENGTSYSPSQGFGKYLYLNILLGISYRLGTKADNGK